MLRKPVPLILLAVLAVLGVRLVFVHTFWSWNDRDAIFEEHFQQLGWPQDLISIGGGYGTTGIAGYRAHTILRERGDLERTYELELERRSPLTGWTLVRASAPR